MVARSTYFLLPAALALAGLSSCGPDLPPDVQAAYERLPRQVDFNYDIKPILSDRCFTCHGPDDEAREAGLRLDLQESATARLVSGNGRGIVPGSLRRSEIVRRILAHDVESKMPPLESKLRLSAEEIALLLRWIEQGAEYKRHWSFLPPLKPEPPVTEPGEMALNPVDHFVLQRVRQQGLEPAAPADRERLIRRVSFDLTGLPPTLEEIDDFLADTEPDAYEKVVDRLLDSDAHAERMAMEWLDVSRYADSHGMHADGWRYAWPWRDWVIEAFRENMPYDQFVTLQLAGDLLPDASREQIIATAFHRNHPMTAEGGVIDEEFRLEYVADRTNTTGTALLGLTLECARCHDHKYDPVTQKEYYQTAAFFNNVKELGMTGDDGNYGPVLLLVDEEQEQALAALGARGDSLSALYEQALSEAMESANAAYASPARVAPLLHLSFDRLGSKSGESDRHTVDGLNDVLASASLELSEGAVGLGAAFDGQYDTIEAEAIPTFDVQTPFSIALWVNTAKRKEDKTQTLLGTSGQKNNNWRGWDLYLEDDNRVSARLISTLPHDYIHVRTRDSIRTGEWRHVGMTYDGFGSAEGVRLFLDGRPVGTETVFDGLKKNIRPIASGSHEPEDRAVRIGKSYRAFTGEFGIFEGRLDEIRVDSRALSEFEMQAVASRREGAADTGPDDEMRRRHQALGARDVVRLAGERRRAIAERVALLDPIPEVMVMEEMRHRRPTFVLARGVYDARREEVTPATPAAILPYPEDLPRNRLGFARWLFLDEHPLTARVAVNRYWQMLLGTGLVRTPQDFGNQGALPSHPELLDWLAVSFRESGWDVRYLLKTIVMSATYRQSSEVPEEERRRDPRNVWLARGPSYRLPAEMIRDNALAASGLLVRTVGGPSVKPYQPEGLWIEKGNFSHVLLRYEQDSGDALFRRSMYTFIRRTSPPPAMSIFDQPPRDVCTVQREHTNTPLQALVLLNDPQFVEAARAVAERVQRETPGDSDAQLRRAFRLLVGRLPTDREESVLRDALADHLRRFTEDPSAARDYLSVGDKPADRSLPPAKTAALAMVSSTVMNLDESYTKR